jgi:hypothetical protein
MTVAEGFERQQIEKLLKEKYPWLQVKPHQEVVHATPKLDDPACGDIFIFDVRRRIAKRGLRRAASEAICALRRC